MNISEVPWQAAIVYKGKFRCGGAIISNRWILTNCYCINEHDVLDLQVRVGSSDRLEGGQLHEIEHLIFHENYNVYHDYDYGLLLTKKEITFSALARPAKLPKIGDADIADATLCLVSGWGVTSDSDEKVRYVEAVEIPKANVGDCKYSYGGRITDRMICIGDYKSGGTGRK